MSLSCTTTLCVFNTIYMFVTDAADGEIHVPQIETMFESIDLQLGPSELAGSDELLKLMGDENLAATLLSLRYRGGLRLTHFLSHFTLINYHKSRLTHIYWEG